MSNVVLRSAFPDLDDHLATWSSTWQLPDLTRGLEIQVSSRLRRSLGRCVEAGLPGRLDIVSISASGVVGS